MLDNIDSTYATASVNWGAELDRPGFNPVSNSQTLTETVSFRFGLGIDEINDIVAFIVHIDPGTIVEIDLTILENVCHDLTGFSRVNMLLVKLLGTLDTDTEGNVLGTACSQITIGSDSATAGAWQGPFATTTDRLSLGNMDFFIVTRRSAKGMAVGSPALTGGTSHHPPAGGGGTDSLLMIQNDDPTIPAAVRVVLYGINSQ